ncbi:tetratricopeptide repeat protein [Pelagicoccus mobilis]|uniref:Tetratricopeptide repeat protein n=1 Tax=Pelagicoccus mobilis TaxID=415221 RepID=A0A934VRT2_9BACT|nr:tetratricopeptide repeat protein [Pelagicoccus mobilis]MBK1878285.1 tetratricopeptide repeat protein [Pelagicoccus mobilis]
MKLTLAIILAVFGVYLLAKLLTSPTPSSKASAPISAPSPQTEELAAPSEPKTESVQAPETEPPSAMKETESKEQRLARRSRELEQLKQTLSKQDYILETAILNAERALHRKSKTPTPESFTQEEQFLLKQLTSAIQSGDSEAKSDFLAALSEHSSPGMYFVGGNFFAESGDIDTAIDFYLTALDTETELPPKLKSRTTKNLGIMLVKQGEHQRSVPYLKEALYLAKEPDPTLLGLIGLSELNTGNLASSEYHYKQAIGIAPDVRDWHVGLTKVLLDQEKYQEAIDHMNAMKANPALGYGNHPQH